MSEGASTIDRKRSMAEPQAGMTRRELFRKGKKVATAALAVTAASGLVGTAGYSVGRVAGSAIGESVSQHSREQYSKILEDSKNMVVGEIKISKEEAPRKSKGIYNDNIEDWRDIIKVNGQDVRGIDKFKLKDVPTTEGGDPDGRAGRGDWIPAIATFSNIFTTWEAVVYFPFGSDTEKAGTVIMDRDHGARYVSIASKDSKSFTPQGYKPIPRTELGKVIR